MIRTAFVASAGHVLIDVDFSSIEARILSWLASETWRLDVFRTHGKIYEASAAQMFGVPIEKIAKGNPEYALRAKGKIAELALGYQGGTGALKAMGAEDMGLTMDDLPEIVQRWRKANGYIVASWKALEDAAAAACESGYPVKTRKITFRREIDTANGLDFLTVELPSFRKLYYANPKTGANRWGNPSLTYTGMNQTTKKWEQIEIYGGKWAENITQAIARDCLAEAAERLETAGYKIVMHCHDEAVIDCPKDEADLARVIDIVSTPAPWAYDLPLTADGWVSPYYKKD
jgi:DNA polymerase